MLTTDPYSRGYVQRLYPIASQVGDGKKQVVGSRVLSEGQLENVLVVLSNARTNYGGDQGGPKIKH